MCNVNQTYYRKLDKRNIMLELMFKSSSPEVFCTKVVPRNFTKLTGKHLCQSLFFIKVAGLSLQLYVRVFRSSLQRHKNLIDYTHICSKFLKSIDRKSKQIVSSNKRSFITFHKEKCSTQDSEKVIFNLSTYVLPHCEVTSY